MKTDGGWAIFAEPCSKGHYWDNWQNLYMGRGLDNILFCQCKIS